MDCYLPKIIRYYRPFSMDLSLPVTSLLSTKKTTLSKPPRVDKNKAVLKLVIVFPDPYRVKCMIQFSLKHLYKKETIMNFDLPLLY